MPPTVNVHNALLLIGKMTLERAEIEDQCDRLAERHNALQLENAELKRRIAVLEGSNVSEFPHASKLEQPDNG